MDTLDLKQPELYINRELSLLEFNQRVLAMAEDEYTPLLERLQFLCISSRNLDEFFEVRVSSLKQMVEHGSVQAGPDNLLPAEILKAIHKRARQQVDDQYRVLNQVILPLLQDKGVRSLKRAEWTPQQEVWLREYFENELMPILSPLGLDPAHPFPRILNKSLNFIVSLTGKDAFGRNSGLAIVQAPRALPRLIQLPSTYTNKSQYDFVFLSSVIHEYVDKLFYGMKATGCYQFRVTRNSDLFVDEEENDDLLRAVEGELAGRHYGDAVRLEVADNCPADVVNFLRDQFHLSDDDIYRVNGPVNLNRVSAMADLMDRPDLKFPAFTPSLPRQLSTSKSIFAAIRKKDILLHHPFESFAPVVEFVRQAAEDNKVLAIKQTLYRTGSESAIVESLLAAARSGKEVTVVIELRARFDEEANVALASRLQEAGVHVVYGVVGYKTHAKMTLIVRRESSGLHHYVHLSTGNYHSRTARLYTDYGLLTCDPQVAEDIHKLFLQLTSLGKVAKHNKILQSPFTLQEALIGLIKREIKHAEQRQPARIIIKVNSLIESQLIQTLYQASGAGVEIDLIVRGICGLRPSVPGVSDRIRVRSVIGRFLEHTRIFYFENNGKPEVYASSADWMPRNLFRRVEIAFPIETKPLQERIVQDLKYYLQDNTQAWRLNADGSYTRLTAATERPFCAQQHLLETLAGAPST
ncbi:MAG: polyphosphate kinase 1 [Gammaproteobacteria bacterium]|nr:polyphosphate kinase 1 [Gammaproteobacteria bacterium]